MGQGQSSSLPSRDEILKKTHGGRDIVNQVFDWMITRTSLRELYSLANPEQCKKYIFLTADALDVLFKHIELEPKEGKKGAIYFQKVEALTKPPSSDDPRARQRQVICLKLAFLYVRIFQIFASLALSVLDVDPKSELKLYEQLQAREESIPLFGPTGRAPFASLQKGGALPRSIGLPVSFEPLRNILSPTGDSSVVQFGNTTTFPRIFLKLESQNNNNNNDLSIIYRYYAMITEKKTIKQITANIKIQIRAMDDSIIIHISNIETGDSTTVANTYRSYKRELGNMYRDSRNRSITDSLLAMFKDMLKKTDGEESKDEDPRVRRDKFAREDRSKESGAVSDGLHTKVLLDAFRQTVPVKSHCVSRALQLLSETGLSSSIPKEVYSSICKVKFMSDNKSLPEADSKITQSYGIYALAQLFYDTLRDSSPAIGEATREQYNAFILKMKYAFEESKEMGKATMLSDVKNRLPSGICSDPKAKDHVLKIKNREVIRQVRSVAGKMLHYQINHTANVVKVLRTLFLLPIESGKPLQIHPNVRKGGMEEINRIAKNARELLIDYYSQCEIMYRQGAEVLVANKGAVGVV